MTLRYSSVFPEKRKKVQRAVVSLLQSDKAYRHRTPHTFLLSEPKARTHPGGVKRSRMESCHPHARKGISAFGNADQHHYQWRLNPPSSSTAAWRFPEQ